MGALQPCNQAVFSGLVKSVDKRRRRVLIGNNRGGTNGWTGFDKVYGIAVSVAGVECPGARLNSGLPRPAPLLHLSRCCIRQSGHDR